MPVCGAVWGTIVINEGSALDCLCSGWRHLWHRRAAATDSLLCSRVAFRCVDVLFQRMLLMTALSATEACALGRLPLGLGHACCMDAPTRPVMRTSQSVIEEAAEGRVPEPRKPFTKIPTFR